MNLKRWDFRGSEAKLLTAEAAAEYGRGGRRETCHVRSESADYCTVTVTLAVLRPYSFVEYRM
jgi:hypothetical protein